MGLKTFNEPLLASYESVSDKTQKRGKEEKREDENLHHPYFINSFGVQELGWENNWQQMLSPATFNHKTNGKKSRTANITATAEVMLRL